jgi:hypothetical protein
MLNGSQGTNALAYQPPKLLTDKGKKFYEIERRKTKAGNYHSSHLLSLPQGSTSERSIRGSLGSELKNLTLLVSYTVGTSSLV